jgi:branched-chain amino acid transport system ATP-binding protein
MNAAAIDRSSRVLEVHDVAIRFGGITALDNVSFGVDRGELIGLIGPNGAGKTTMLRAISGQLRPQNGQVLLEGRDLRGFRMARRARAGLAMSNQIVRPFRHLSVLDNVALAVGHQWTASPLIAITKVSREQQRQTALGLLELVGIRFAAEAAPSTQPLGVLKRLEMARALAMQPAVLLLDEPLAGLNQAEANRLADTVRDINVGGTTIVLIEHNLAEAQRICQRFVVLDNGRKIADGPVTSVMTDDQVITAYLGAGWRDAQH